VQFTRQRLEWQAIDSAVSADLRALQGVRDGDFTIDSRDRADRKWIVTYVVSDGPVAFYLYERPSRRATLLFVHRPALERYTLARMEPVAFAARDSLRLYGYLTLPPGKEPKRLPLVMLVHGGPWGRDVWGYNPDVQWLANRGYAVLQVNYRGSTGYGKAHLNAGDREWAGKMHTDLLDAKAWAVEQGYADPERTCIYGGSYGGYATLVGLAFTPGEFACGVDLVGPSNLVTLIQTIPPYWASFKAVIDKRLGKLGKDDEFLRARSPLFRADSIRAPLMIVQGANDPRVKQAESDQIVAAMRKNGQTVKYIVFPDEGHGFARPENKLRFYAAAEPFFAEYLGGRVEPAAAEEKVEPFVQ
jgi:dipeptidyl aminopeptidase/acylaminoacyl peptidase